MTSAFDLNQLQSLFIQQEKQGIVQGLDAVQQNLQRRKEIETHLNALSTYLHECQQRLQRLPHLPVWHEVQWAKAVLALPNVAFLEVDTDGLNEDARVLRVLLMDKYERVIFDTLVNPERPLSDKIRHITGIQVDLTIASSLSEVWPMVIMALRGRYVLAYNRPFDLDMLNRAAERLQQPLPVILGEDIMQHASAYLRTYTTKLETLCERFGSPLPAQPERTALHRAQGQVRLLRAMSQARLTTSDIPDVQGDGVESDEDDDDEQPF